MKKWDWYNIKSTWYKQTTPNPNSLKFLSEKVISSIGTEEFQKSNSKNLNNTFIKELLEFKGVELVLLSQNFLSVKKQTTLLGMI